MKQYTTPEQTARLIELGFEKPKGWCVDGISSRLIMCKHKEDDEGFNYSIGELIEMLDKVGVTTYIRFGGARAIFLSNNKGREMLGGQLIDLLFVMIVELKEEGVI